MGSERVWAFDLDGVLCDAFRASSAKSWRRMSGAERTQRREELATFYVAALPLFRPTCAKFHVVTARKESERVVTQAWLTEHLGERVMSLHMLNVGRTIENVVAFKADALRELGATDFHEDNRQIVRGLRRAVQCRVWWFTKGQMVLDYEAPWR